MIRPVVFVVLLGCLPAFALEGFPSFVRLPDDVSTATVRITNFDEVALPLGGPTDTYKEGKVTEAFLKFEPEGSRPADATWKAWAPMLAKDGWKVTWEEGNRRVLKRKTSDGERLLAVYVGDSDEPKLILVEPVVKPPKLDFPAPAAQVEKVSDTQDYPFLPAYPGAKLTETFHSDNVMLAQLPGSESAEVLAQGAVIKSYQPPPTLSAYETDVVMRDALTRAGWEPLPRADPKHPDGNLIAHYAKNGRNIWVWITRAADDSGGGLRYQVADVGAENWAEQLKSACRLTLTGVNFDFNKASLRKDSSPALEKAASTLKGLNLKIEVQGHTDNVGQEAYNDKLSTQRAESVRAWLVAHGVAADRLTSKGYGQRQPVADNDSDAGRAKNRRVELSCAKN